MSWDDGRGMGGPDFTIGAGLITIFSMICGLVISVSLHSFGLIDEEMANPLVCISSLIILIPLLIIYWKIYIEIVRNPPKPEG